MMKTFLTAVLMLIFSQIVSPQGWQWVNTGYNFIMYDVSFPSGQSDIGYAVGSSVTYNGNGIILKTTDAGQSWFQISVGTIPGLEAVSFTSVDVGYAGGWQNYFIKTTDGGATWNQINIDPNIWYFKEIEFWDANNGMTSTADPQIYVTTNAGATWTPATGLNQGVEDICYVDGSIAYAVGGDEKISRSTDGGLSWTGIYSGIFTRLFLGVSFYDANYGIVSGEEGKVMVTTNGGTNWTTTDAGGFGLMRSAWIFNQDSSYVVGTPEQIYKSTNGGMNWVEDFVSGYQEALYKIKFTENGVGIICGSQGKFLRNTDYVTQQEPAESYVFNGGQFRYGTLNLTTGAFTSLDFYPQGSNYYPATADNKEENAQYTIMSDFNWPSNYYLWHVDFTTLTGDSIAPVGPLASGQSTIKGMAYNVVNDTWYVISGDDFGNAAYLYSLDITTGVLSQIGQIQNANLPVGIAIDCNGNAYIINVTTGISSTAILNSLNLSTAVATPIGTNLGLDDVSGYSQDLDFNPDNGNLYWTGSWSAGFFGGGVSFRLVDVTTGTSTEIAAFGEFETLTGFNVNGICTSTPPTTPISYAFNGDFYKYGTVDLSTGAFTSLDFFPPGSNYQPITGDNLGTDEQYAIMANMSFNTFYLWNINFSTLSGDSIGVVGPLASGQTVIKGIAHNTVTDTWYVVSSNDFGDAAFLYTINITNGELTQVGQITGANLPVGIAINCEGTAYIVDVVVGISSTGIFKTLDLSSAVATAIGTNLGLTDISGYSQDLDFNPETGELYWGAYWSSGFFSSGGSFRLIDITNGTSTEITALGEFTSYISFSINALCSIVPVELTSFSANVNDNIVTLNWSTATEINNSGFEIERKSANSVWTNIGFVTGSGSTTEIRNYSYSDNSVTSGRYSYRLKQVDYNGSFEYSQEVFVDVTPTMNYALQQNYPNPFNPSTKIRFTIPQASIVNLTVFNAIGEQVKTLVNNYYEAGTHEVVFNASTLTSGIYFVRMESGSFVSTRKITLLK